MVSGRARKRGRQVAASTRTGTFGQARLEAAREIHGVRLFVGSGREHSIVGWYGDHTGRAGYRAQGWAEPETGSIAHERGARGGARQGRCPGAQGPAVDYRCASPDALAPARGRSARVRAAESPGDSRHFPALGASSWTDDGLPAPAWVEGAVGVWTDSRRSELRMMRSANGGQPFVTA